MSKRAAALLAATLVSIIYGVTFTVAKDVMPKYIDAFGFIVLRVFGTAMLFWMVWFLYFVPFGRLANEKIDRKDIPRILAAAFSGVALNMLTFFKGLSLTTPISAAVIMVTTPIIVLILSALMISERMHIKRVIGIILGLAGTAFLILYGKESGNASNPTLGNTLVFINAASYGFYLIIVRKLMDKYNAFTFVKWIYLFGFFMVLPFGFGELQQVEWQSMPADIYWKVGFVIVFSTFLTYLLNLLSMRELSSSTVAVFIYLQPLFATVFAIGLGKDQLTWVKIVAAIMIFVGVYLVTLKQESLPGNPEAV